MATDTKVALVTGANKGIGLETARQLGRQGITVLIGARDAAKGEEAAKSLTSEGIDARALMLDVTDDASIHAAVAQVAQEFGHLDILINNAGLGTFGKPTSQEPLDEWRRLYETNVFGLVATTQAFLPLIRQSAAGRIVNLSSILGSIAMRDPKSPIGAMAGSGAAYGSSKAAVNLFTASLAKELSRTPIKVNAAHPGWVKTDMGGDGAPMEIEDGAKTSVRLATLGEDGPTGGYFHFEDRLPW